MPPQFGRDSPLGCPRSTKENGTRLRVPEPKALSDALVPLRQAISARDSVTNTSPPSPQSRHAKARGIHAASTCEVRSLLQVPDALTSRTPKPRKRRAPTTGARIFLSPRGRPSRLPSPLRAPRRQECLLSDEMLRPRFQHQSAHRASLSLFRHPITLQRLQIQNRRSCCPCRNETSVTADPPQETESCRSRRGSNGDSSPSAPVIGKQPQAVR